MLPDLGTKATTRLTGYEVCLSEGKDASQNLNLRILQPKDSDEDQRNWSSVMFQPEEVSFCWWWRFLNSRRAQEDKLEENTGPFLFQLLPPPAHPPSPLLPLIRSPDHLSFQPAHMCPGFMGDWAHCLLLWMWTELFPSFLPPSPVHRLKFSCELQPPVTVFGDKRL